MCKLDQKQCINLVELFDVIDSQLCESCSDIQDVSLISLQKLVMTARHNPACVVFAGKYSNISIL